jgi:DNA-binding XRE family transcriptional regulator
MENEFGKLIRVLRAKKDDLKQWQMAKDLGCSDGHISNVEKGKGRVAPEFSWLVKCRNYFNLSNEETVDFFKKAFSSYKEINLNMECFPEEQKEWLVSIIVFLLLFPVNPSNFMYKDMKRFMAQMPEYFRSLIKDGINDLSSLIEKAPGGHLEPGED